MTDLAELAGRDAMPGDRIKALTGVSWEDLQEALA
jgi:hypothetical protein